MEYEKTKADYKQKLDVILEENKKALSRIEGEYREKYDEMSKQHIRLINDMKWDGEKFDVALEQCEQEYERELGATLQSDWPSAEGIKNWETSNTG